MIDKIKYDTGQDFEVANVPNTKLFLNKLPNESRHVK